MKEDKELCSACREGKQCSVVGFNWDFYPALPRKGRVYLALLLRRSEQERKSQSLGVGHLSQLFRTLEIVPSCRNLGLSTEASLGKELLHPCSSIRGLPCVHHGSSGKWALAGGPAESCLLTWCFLYFVALPCVIFLFFHLSRLPAHCCHAIFFLPSSSSWPGRKEGAK